MVEACKRNGDDGSAHAQESMWHKPVKRQRVVVTGIPVEREISLPPTPTIHPGKHTLQLLGLHVGLHHVSDVTVQVSGGCPILEGHLLGTPPKCTKPSVWFPCYDPRSCDQVWQWSWPREGHRVLCDRHITARELTRLSVPFMTTPSYA